MADPGLDLAQQVERCTFVAAEHRGDEPEFGVIGNRQRFVDQLRVGGVVRQTVTWGV